MIYFDSSALVKLIIAEPQSRFLAAYVAQHSDVLHVSSALTVTELRRTLHRLEAPPEAEDKATEVIEGLTLVPVNRPVLDYAAALPGQHLRSLDAIHLASALRLRSALTALVTYDNRLEAAATEVGVRIDAPA